VLVNQLFWLIQPS